MFLDFLPLPMIGRYIGASLLIVAAGTVDAWLKTDANSERLEFTHASKCLRNYSLLIMQN